MASLTSSFKVSSTMSRFRYFFLYYYIFFKMLIVSAWYIIKEGCSTIKPLKDSIQRKGEYAVITGGEQGIGWHTIKGLVRSKMRVIVGCRDGPCRSKLFKKMAKQGWDEESVEWIELDLSSMDSVRTFVKRVLEKDVPISLLINNAGIMAPPYTVTKDGYELQFAVNYLASFLLTHLLMPRLVASGKKNSATRIINITSAAQAFGWFDLNDLQSKSFYSPFGAYSQSKAAQIMFTKILDQHLRDSNQPVRCYAIHPGWIKSKIFSNIWYTKVAALLFGFLYKTKAEGSQRVLFTAFSQTMEHLSGNYFENSEAVDPIALVRNRKNQQKLWDISCLLVEIQKFGCP